MPTGNARASMVIKAGYYLLAAIVLVFICMLGLTVLPP
jgi:hypothetical protein